MRYVSLKNTGWIPALALALSLSSCSLKSNGQPQTLTIALPGGHFSLMDKLTDWMNLAWAGTTTAATLDTDPATLSDFDCLGVNVSGPGINLDPNVTCSDPTDAPAIFGGFVPNGSSSIDLLVPAGPGRKITIFGVKSLVGCPNLHDLISNSAFQFNGNIGHFYTIGNAQQDIFDDSTATITASYNSASPIRTFNNCNREGEVGGTHLWGVYAGTGTGGVAATKTVGTTTYIGGSFDYVGPTTQSGAILSQTTGAPVATANSPAHISGTVRCAVKDGLGGFYVGGNFSHVESIDYSTTHAVAIHVRADGSFDSSFVLTADSSSANVYACAFDGTYLYLGGDFASLKITSSVTTGPLAAIGVSDQSIHAMGTGLTQTTPVVYALDFDSVTSRVYAGGLFNFNTTHKNAAAFDATTLSLIGTWTPDPDNNVYAIMGDSTAVYLAGTFSNVNVTATSTARSYLAKVNASNGGVASWDAGLTGPAVAITKDATYIYVEARTATPNTPNIYRIDPTLATATSIFSTASSADGISAIAFSTDKTLLYVGGKFQYGPQRNLVAIQNPSSSPVVSSGFIANSNTGAFVNAIAPDALGKIFVGGTFPSIGGVVRNNLAALDLNSGQATTWNPTPAATIGPVSSMDSDGSYIYAGYQANTPALAPPGVLKIITGASASDAGNWQKTTSNYSTDIVNTVTLNGGYLYVGGTFTQLDSTNSLTGAARMDLAGNVDGTWNPIFNGGSSSATIRQILVNNGTVYLGGGMSQIGAVSTYGIAAVKTTDASVATGWGNPGLINTIWSMVFDPSGQYIIAGTISSGPTADLHLINPSTGADVTGAWLPNTSSIGIPHKLVVSGNTLYVAGDSKGASYSGVLAFDFPSAASIPTFQANIQNGNSVSSLELTSQGLMILGGNFQQVNVNPADGTGGKMSPGIGAFNAASGALY
jgi:hypothetical protein